MNDMCVLSSGAKERKLSEMPVKPSAKWVLLLCLLPQEIPLISQTGLRTLGIVSFFCVSFYLQVNCDL